MKVQTAKRRIRLQEWAAQINCCNQSGQTVRQWCAENGINTKTYYNHVKRVREELLEAIEGNNPIPMPGLACSYEVSSSAPPVFAALPISQIQGAAVTICLGECAVEIRNGADHALVEQVLKVVARL